MITNVHSVLLWMTIWIVVISSLIVHLIVIGRFLWTMDDNSILVIIYDTQACTFGTIILLMKKSLLMRPYNNCLSSSGMLGESVFCSNLWLNPWCGKQSEIDIPLMMHDRFFVNFPLIGNNVLVFLSGYFFQSSFLYNRCLSDFKPLLILGSVVIPYSGLHTLLNLLIFRRDFLLLPFFFNTDLCGPILLSFLVGRKTTLVNTTLSNRLVVESTWLVANWSGKIITEWSLYSEFVDRWLLSKSSLLKCNIEDLNLVDLQTISSWRRI